MSFNIFNRHGYPPFNLAFLLSHSKFAEGNIKANSFLRPKQLNI